MLIPQRNCSQGESSQASGAALSVPTDGEVNFLWWFIQGSIMNPQTWSRLLRSIGFCERHAWIHIGVEMSFREAYLMGPAILYGALIEKCLRVVWSPQTFGLRSVIRQLRAAGPCLLCTNVKEAPAGLAPQDRLDRGRGDSELRKFAREMEPLWRGSLCPHCSGETANAARAALCRRHLLAATEAGISIDLVVQRKLLQQISNRLAQYQKSFCFGGPEANDQERAALISAIGWCSGWQPLLARLRQAARKA
jgi:hypothetical protein